MCEQGRLPHFPLNLTLTPGGGRGSRRPAGSPGPPGARSLAFSGGPWGSGAPRPPREPEPPRLPSGFLFWDLPEGAAGLRLKETSSAWLKALIPLVHPLQVQTSTETPASRGLPGTGVTQERPTPFQAPPEPQDRKGSAEPQVRAHLG